MAWLKYLKENGHVVEITEEEPIIDETLYGKVSDNYHFINDEFTYYIVVNFDTNGVFIGTSSIRQAPAAVYILQQLKEKNDRIVDLEMAIAAILGGA